MKMDDADFEKQGILEQAEHILEYLESSSGQTIVPDARVRLLRKTLSQISLSGLIQIDKILDASKDLFDNILGWSDNRSPYAPRELWANLGEVLYDKENKIVKELRSGRMRNE